MMAVPVAIGMAISVAMTISIAVPVCGRIAGFERGQFLRIFPEATPAKLFLLFVLAFVNPPAQFFHSLIEAGGRGFAAADFDAALRGVVERVVRDADERCRVLLLRDGDLALFPHLYQVMPPRLLQSRKEKIGSAKKKNFRSRCIAARQSREVLINHRFEER